MKKVLIWIFTIITFIVLVPISFLFFCFLAIIQQGHPINSIIQAVVMFICALGLAGMGAKALYNKLLEKFGNNEIIS